MNRLGIGIALGLALLAAVVGGVLAFRRPEAASLAEGLPKLSSPPPKPAPAWGEPEPAARKVEAEPALPYQKPKPVLTRLEGKLYVKVRRELRALGYKPLVFRCYSTSEPYDKLDCGWAADRFPEVLDCSQGALAACEFGWVDLRTRRYLMVYTTGEYRPEVSAIVEASWGDISDDHRELVSPRGAAPPARRNVKPGA